MYVAALGRTVDCVDAAANCIMAVSDYFNSQTLLKVPIAFAPPPSPPTTRGSIAIEPGTATGNELVRVTGSGFLSGRDRRGAAVPCQSKATRLIADPHL